MSSACTNVWVRDQGNYIYPVEKIVFYCKIFLNVLHCGGGEDGDGDGGMMMMKTEFPIIISKETGGDLETYTEVLIKRISQQQTNYLCRYIIPVVNYTTYKIPRWTFPILRKGWKNNLKFEDYSEIPSNLKTKNLDEEFSKFYGMKKQSVWALIWTLFMITKNYVLTSWFWAIVMELVQKPLKPLLISLLLAEEQKKQDYKQSTALLYAMSTCFLILSRPVVYHQCLFKIGVAGMIVRSALSSAIYKKITRITQQGFMKTNTGEIMNILTNDMNRFTADLQYTIFVITSPLQCIIVSVILWYTIGALPVIGLLGFIIMIPLQILFGRILFKFRKKVLKATDARIKLIYEIISSMKIIKLYAWEDSFWKHVFEKRKLLRIQQFPLAICLHHLSGGSTDCFRCCSGFGPEMAWLNVNGARDGEGYLTQTISPIAYWLFRASVVPSTAATSISRKQISHEFEQLRGIIMFKGASLVIQKSMVNVVILLSMFGFVLQNQDNLTVPKVYLAITMFNSVKYSISKFFGNGLNGIAQILSSIQRIYVKSETRLNKERVNHCLNHAWFYTGFTVEGYMDELEAYQENLILDSSVFNQAYSISCDNNEDTRAHDIVIGIVAARLNSSFEMGDSENKQSGIRIVVPYTSPAGEFLRSSFAAVRMPNIIKTRESVHLKFLSIEEYPIEYPSETIQSFKEKLLIDSKLKPIVKLHKVYSSYGKDTENVVKDISFSLNPGDYLCVIGEVGSGKTSLLKTILKEMVVNSGTINVRGNIAYSCQQSWIFSDTLKNNILFGSKYDQERYQNIINACCLSMDINLMKYGDETVVGERGIKLSGGQRARISLARALYYDADVYLLDDPLSAVDAEVGNHLYLQYNIKSVYGTYETILEKLPNLTTFCTDSFKKSVTSTKEIKGEQAIFKRKEVDGVYKLDNIKEATGNSVSWKVYKQFFRAAGNPYLILLTSISLNIIYVLILLGFDYWIKIWTELEDQNNCLHDNCTSTEHLGFSSNFLFQNNQNSLIILSIICLISILFSIPTIFYDIMFCLRAARNLHDQMFNKLLHAPIKFYNCNPIGEILNRFTKDIGEIDEYIPEGYQDVLQQTIKCIVLILAVCLVEPYLFIVTCLMIVLAVFVAKIYTKTYTVLKRAENITKSPVFTHVSMTLDGLSTIRAYGALDRFRMQFHNLQDLNMASYYMYFSIQRWFCVYSEFIGSLMIFCITITPVLFHTALSASSIGFIISQLVHVTGAIQMRIITSLTLQSRFTSVERVLEYGAIHSEADRECAEEDTPPDNWPHRGSIFANNVSLAYDKNTCVLKDICFSINGGQKVGVIGRTGAGKTSLVNAIFRLAEPSGCLKIDGIDISKIGIHQLRRNISIIPQEPLLFKNTIRYNLDPFGFYNEAKLWSALESVELKAMVGQFPEKLDTTFTEGTNLSVGEQQLICLARAILKENKIIILDEATSSVDVITDKIIQKTIRTKFKDFTVITIAHRIHTIIDADVIMVIDNGYIIEMDSPKNLVQNKDSHFYKTILETGSSAPLLIKQCLG
ncbi:Multidrug resistance-associated protein 4 [Nymphon striatum]|nr:Multidrug resistance-associated protein 4 [Nymphon striatum]